MTDRVPEMVEHLTRRLQLMTARKRRPGTDPAADMKASLYRRWPDMTEYEFTAATLGLARHLSAAESTARPANDRGRRH